MLALVSSKNIAIIIPDKDNVLNQIEFYVLKAFLIAKYCIRISFTHIFVQRFKHSVQILFCQTFLSSTYRGSLFK